MPQTEVPFEQSLMHTRSGRTIAISRYAPEVLPLDQGRIVLETACEPYDRDAVWILLTPGEAGDLASLLVRQAAAVSIAPER
ncbi:hypothetical protein [Kitasatospora sp. NPDC088351]|uniref:hypothetical protein n=1 Tax=unclassified Kitasatospora TaxID=2633591 RepID=UPI003426D51D